MSLSFKLFSHYVTDIVVGDEKILFTTALGDVVEVIVSEKKNIAIQKNVVNKIKVTQNLNYLKSN